MRKILCISFLLTIITAFGQTNTPEYFGFRQIVCKYKNDNVDILIFSKRGEENVKKPLFFFCQGSLPKPLIIYDENGGYGNFPFIPDSLSQKYHLVIVSKPFIPVMAHRNTVQPNYLTYVDSLGNCPKEYSDRNLLSYYAPRNIKVIKYLQKQKWVSSTQLVVAGHSEGSSVAAKMAVKYNRITHLIYSGGNPMGRIMSIIGGDRARESDTDSTRFGENSFRYWEKVVENKKSMDASHGDTYKATFEFSYPFIKYLKKLKIPTLISFGTKDACAPFNDFLQVETIRQGKKNFTFNAYIGTEHNYFPLTEDGKPDFSVFNWDKVADEWLDWLNNN